MQSLFAMLFLHKKKKAGAVKEILEWGFALAGVRPAILRSNGTGEYGDEALANWLLMLRIDHQWLGAGIPAILLQSNLPIEFWGLAALYIVDTLACLGYNWDILHPVMIPVMTSKSDACILQLSLGTSAQGHYLDPLTGICTSASVQWTSGHDGADQQIDMRPPHS
eukprot:423734-Rhodomonas_salina.1